MRKIIDAFGNTRYLEYGPNGEDLLHRTNGPAYIGKSGRQVWWYQGTTHRENGPAVIRETIKPTPDAPPYSTWRWMGNKIY